MANTTQKMTDEDYAKEQLHKILKPGDRVYCILRHVSRSGMMRHISFYTLKGGDMRFLDGYISQVLDYKRVPRDKGEGLKVHGCGMDMGFAVVYNLGRALFSNGFKVKGRGRNGDTSGWDKDGGYGLKSEWL